MISRWSLVESIRITKPLSQISKVLSRMLQTAFKLPPSESGTRSTKLDMITYKRAMLPGLQPLNLRCTLHRIKVNTALLFSASEVRRCENTTRVTRFFHFSLHKDPTNEKKNAMQHTKQRWQGCVLIKGSVVGSLGEGRPRAQIHTP